MTRFATARALLPPLAALCALAGPTGCQPDLEGVPFFGDETYLLPSGEEPIEFVVDSIVYDPAVGGTARDSTRSLWRLRPLADSASVDEVVFEVDVIREGERIGGLLWAWENRERRSVNTLDGVSLFGLIAPFSEQTTWDPLRYTNPDAVLSIAGEPVAAFKRWRGAIDSIGVYTEPDGGQVEAVWVQLADDENLLELREVSEIYGRDRGLLARSVRILDTQNTDAELAWADKAERGFEVYLTRR